MSEDNLTSYLLGCDPFEPNMFANTDRLLTILRDLRHGIFNDQDSVNALLDEAIALREAEGQKPVQKVLTDEEIDAIAADEATKRGHIAKNSYNSGVLYGLSVGLRIARARGYLAPSAGLTVDDAIDGFHAWITANHNGWSGDAKQQDLRDRLEAAAKGK